MIIGTFTHLATVHGHRCIKNVKSIILLDYLLSSIQLCNGFIYAILIVDVYGDISNYTVYLNTAHVDNIH